MATTLQSGRNVDVPPVIAKINDGTILILDGVNTMQRWDAVSSTTGDAGITAPSSAPTVGTPTTGGASAGDYTCYYRYKDSDGNVSSMSPPTTVTAAANDKFSWSGLTLSSQSRVSSIELWRSLVGVPNLVYLITTLNNTGTPTYADDTESDATLVADRDVNLREITQILASDFSPVANVFTPPPSYTRSMVIHQTRAYYGGNVDYRVGHASVTNSSTTVTLVGGTVTSVMADWYFYVEGQTAGYEVSSVNTGANTLTLATAYAGSTDAFAEYGLRPSPNKRNLVHYSEVGLPEAVFYDELTGDNVTQQYAFAMRLQDNGDDLVHVGPSMHGYLYVAQRNHLFRINCSNCNPRQGANFQLVARRGSVGHRAAVVAHDAVYFMDTEGVYRVVADGGDEDISTSIRDFFRGDRIHWNRSDWFFADVDKARTQVRFWVCLGTERWPRHALCWNYVLQTWSLEETHWALGAAALVRLQGRETLFVAGEHEQVWEYGGQTCDAREDLAVTGTATAATQDSLTDSSASFSGSMLGLPVCVTSGTGKRQVRRIVGVESSGTRLRLKDPWIITPDTTSQYLVGGIPWSWKTGIYEYAETDREARRSHRLTWEPTDSVTSMDLRVYVDHDKTPVAANRVSSQGALVSIDEDSPDVEISLTRTQGDNESGGFVDVQWGGQSATGRITADRYSAAELRGFQGPSPVEVYEVRARGVTR